MSFHDCGHCLPGFKDLSPEGGVRSKVCQEDEEDKMAIGKGAWIGIVVLIALLVLLAVIIILVRRQAQKKSRF